MNIRNPFIYILFLGYLSLTLLSEECTKDSYQATFTPCENGTRNLIYYKKHSSQNCTPGIEAPHHVYSIQCDIYCKSGEYLPIGAKECSKCPIGHYSLGGGVRIDSYDWKKEKSWNTSFELKFTTYCEQTVNREIEPCSGWEIGDGFIDSGTTANNQINILHTAVKIITIEGHVRFRYRVDAEPRWDGFYFSIDKREVLGSIRNPISNQVLFKEAIFPLDEGIHILEWGYKKDFTKTEGADKVVIDLLEVVGIKMSDITCTPCSPGYYIGDIGSSECKECPLNTYSSIFAASNCTDCATTDFSYSGSSGCTRRRICTSDDFETSYTLCINEKRNLTHKWKDPMICDSSQFQLPSDVVVPCATCNAGTVRMNNSCEPCPSGFFAREGSDRCYPCPSGTVSPRVFIMRRFEELPDIANTTCQGICETRGWRLLDTVMDSGVGHGVEASVQFSINVTIEEKGNVNFSYKLDCLASSLCYLSFVVPKILTRNYYHITTVTDFKTINLDIPKGNHTLSWTFHKNDPHLEGRNDRAIINNIEIKGVKGGGAEVCVPCNAGQYAPPNATLCKECSPGYYSTNRSDQCTICPQNTFSDTGSVECIPCSSGTSSPPGSNQCIHNCTFSPSPDIVYDLSHLNRSEMYGPIEDNQKSTHKYYISICTKTNTSRYCYNPLRNVSTYTCDSFTGADLGNVIGFSTLPNSDSGEGLVITYSYGSMCVQNTTIRPRQTNVTMLCDPTAGFGSPHPALKDSINGITDNNCDYHFVWESIYACPLCTKNDWEETYGDCIEGKQLKSFTWVENPKRCHGGLQLPPSLHIPCETDSTIQCMPGERFIPEGNEHCKNCSRNHYSIGGGSIIDYWIQNISKDPSQILSTYCMSNCKGQLWQPKQQYIQTGGPFSILQWRQNFVREGTLTFDFKGVFVGDQFITVYRDGIFVMKIKDNSLDWRTYQFNVSVGTHEFLWIKNSDNLKIFEQSYDYGFQLIRNIAAVGTVWHDGKCQMCPPGFHTQDVRSTSCISCPPNEYNPTPGSDCRECTADTYAPSGSSRCYVKPMCNKESYRPIYSECNAKTLTRNITWILKDAEPCIEDSRASPKNISIPCECAPGYYLSSNNCVACQNGTYVFQLACVVAPPGYAAVKTNMLIGPHATQNSLPEFIHKQCSGSCTSTWRLANNALESGLAMGISDSFMRFKVRLEDEYGHIGLKYNMSYTQKDSTLQVFIDNNLVTYRLGGTTGHIDIPLYHKKDFEITINFHEEDPKSKRRILPMSNAGVILTEFNITGTSEGGGILVECPPGTYSTGSTTYCHFCPPGTSSGPRSSFCTPCTNGTWSSHTGSTRCRTCPYERRSTAEGNTLCTSKSCEFKGRTNKYELSDIGFGKIGDSLMEIIVDSTKSYLINICGKVDDKRCVTANNITLNTHVCEIHNDGNAIGFGSDINFAEIDNGIIIDFGDGDRCFSYENETVKHRTSKIKFTCARGPDFGLPFLRTYLSDECSLYFEWNTRAACRACIFPDDYIQTTIGRCTRDKQQKITYVVSMERSCYSSKGVIVKLEHCQPPLEFPIAVVILAVIVPVTLLIGATVLYIKHRRLEQEYTLLLNRAPGDDGLIQERTMEL